MPSERTDNLYRFILADLAVRASVVLNSVRHDLRFAHYLRAGVPALTQRGRLDGPIQMLKAVEGSLRHDVIERAITCQRWSGRIDQRMFNTWRSEIQRSFRAAYSREAVLYGHLRAVYERLPSDMTYPWTRLETTDTAPLDFLLKVGTHAADVACDWATKVLKEKVEARVAVDLAHSNEVVSHESREITKHDGYVLHHALQIPFHLVHVFRYAPLVVHEACHAAVRLVLARRPGWVRERASLIENALAVHVSLPGDMVERQTSLVTMTTEILIESLVDEMSYRIAGPSYLLALSSWVLGRTSETSELAFDYALPIGARLRRLVEKYGSMDGPAGQFCTALREDLDDFDNRVNAVRKGYSGYRQAIHSIVGDSTWLPVELNELGDSEDGDRVRNLLTDLWRDALVAFDGNEVDQRVSALARLKEGRTVARHYGPDVNAEIAHHSTTWRSLRFYLRGDPDTPTDAAKPTCLRDVVTGLVESIGSLEYSTGDAEDAPSIMSRGIVGAVLGPADLLAFTPHAHTREDDGIDRIVARLGGAWAYVVRRLLFRVSRVGTEQDPQYLSSKPPPWTPALFLVVELSLDNNGDAADVVQYLKRTVRWLSDSDDAWPWAIFRGLGWADLTLIIGLQKAEILAEVGQNVLTAEGLCVRRSISHVLVLSREIGMTESKDCASDLAPDSGVCPDGQASLGDPRTTLLRVAHRLTRADQLEALVARLCDSGNLPRGNLPRGTMGQHDVHVDYPLTSAGVAQAVAMLGWQLQQELLVTRSVTSVVLP